MNLRWIFIALFATLAIAIIWRNEVSDNADPSWTKCTESLLEQMVSNKCTLRFEAEQTQPS